MVAVGVALIVRWPVREGPSAVEARLSEEKVPLRWNGTDTGTGHVPCPSLPEPHLLDGFGGDTGESSVTTIVTLGRNRVPVLRGQSENFRSQTDIRGRPDTTSYPDSQTIVPFMVVRPYPPASQDRSTPGPKTVLPPFSRTMYQSHHTSRPGPSFLMTGEVGSPFSRVVSQVTEVGSDTPWTREEWENPTEGPWWNKSLSGTSPRPPSLLSA